MLLEGKRVLVTGVLTDASIAYAVATRAAEQGAELVLTGAGRGLPLTRRTARKLPGGPPVLELDVTDADHLTALSPSLEELGWDRVDGVVHAIGFAPKACLGSGMFTAGWEDVSVALQVSAYSLKALTEA
ncbi:MAG: SDR family oxidoreductase, partial [Actinomycetota bacterium]|nr:SDR family oxidoreductase [Actinomycetota bacterium]